MNIFMEAISIGTIIGWLLSAFIGGAGIVGLLMMKPKHDIEKKIKQNDNDRERLNKVDDIDKAIHSIREEQTLQCHCILACLKGLAEQGCNGPVHEGIEKMEKYLNKRAHDQ